MTNNSNTPVEGNKLIADFMGLKFDAGKKDAFKFYKESQQGSWKSKTYINPTYHSSWNWLMPVCKKIIGLYSDKREDIYSGLCECDITATWKAVIAFIQFWNDPTQEKLTWSNKPSNYKPTQS